MAEDSRNLNEFNVMSTEWGICLSSTRIDEKSNGIPEMQKAIKQIDCRGCIVTADALNTQKATARAIVKEAHGEYCLALKENHKTAYEEIKEYFSCEDFRKRLMGQDGRYLKETEHTSDRMITREYFITNDIQWFEDRKEWEKLFGLIRRFVMFIIKLLKVYYHRSMKQIRNKIGRNLEVEIPVILATLKVLYDKDMLDAIDELSK